MKKTLSLVCIACGLFFGVTRASVISADEARAVAINFFKVNASGARDAANLSATLNYTRSEADNTIDFYVFDMSPLIGFVIVAADDNIKPVIAYSTESYFNSNLNKTGVVDWMNHAAQHIAKMKQLHVAADQRINGLWAAYRAGVDPISDKSNVVMPLVKTLWNQAPDYNAFCPYNTVDHQRAVTGCVATAMAQIMKFWNFPSHGIGGSHSYDAKFYGQGSIPNYDYGNQSADFNNTTYNWPGMLNSIGANDTAIATLMYQCGVSVDMNYGDDNEGGSGAIVLISDAGGFAPSAQASYSKYFSYDASAMQGIYESSYDSSDWLSALEGELNAGRPLQYEGDDATYGGHTWVCDGYDANNLLHMNWGWGGASNGYYAVSNLNGGGYLFNEQEAALIGIEPIAASVQVNAGTTLLCAGDTTTLHGIANATGYSWTPTTGLSCPTCQNTLATPAVTTTYTLTIDSSGVQGLAWVTISVKAGPVISNGNVTNATCNGTADGSAEVSVSGGTPGYTFLWSNGNTSALDTSLNPGVYYITATDGGGCQAVTLQVVGSNTAPIVVTPTITSASCKASNGAAVIAASGGSGNSYTYIWAQGSTTDEISNVPAGIYALTVTDGSCLTATNVQIPQQDQLNVVIATDASNGGNGSASVEAVTGGNGPFTYDWITAGSSSQTVNGLAPGTYPVVVTDANGCYDTATAVVSVATGITPVSNALVFSAYPNPSKGQLIVQLNKLANGTYVKVENILGQTMLNRPVTDLQTQLDLSSFSDGVYLVEIVQGDRRMVKQIVVSR